MEKLHSCKSITLIQCEVQEYRQLEINARKGKTRYNFYGCLFFSEV
jgi:hypothetical protein